MKRRALIMVLLMFGVAILIPAIGRAAEQKVIKIGVIGPLSGDSAWGGQYQLNGARLKAEELNATGSDIQIEIISEDDASKPDQSLAAAKKLIARDKIHALLGAWNSTCTLAILPITAAEGVPQLTTSIAGPITQQGSKWIFRTNAHTSVLNYQTLEYVVREMGLKKIAIFTSNEEVGKSARVTAENALQKLGLKPVAKEEWSVGDKDFTGQLGRIQASGADGLFFTIGFKEMAIIARQVRQLGMKVQLVGGDTLPGNKKFLELAGPDVVGMTFSILFLPVEDHPRVGPFVRNYQKRFNQVPDGHSAQFYDAVGVIHAAVKGSGVVDREKIRDYIRGLKKGTGYKGIMGDQWWDEKGETMLQLMIGRVIPGEKWEILR